MLFRTVSRRIRSNNISFTRCLEHRTGAFLLCLLVLVLGVPAVLGLGPRPTAQATQGTRLDPAGEAKLQTVTLGAGCFWCVEAVFARIPGVVEVVSGYMGGHVSNPTYEQVITGRTGHAEVVRVRFQPDVLSFSELLAWFWQAHDPTTLNRQGADVGPMYRSAIFYHNEEQGQLARESLVRAQAGFEQPIVTEITAATTFYPAEDYHQAYFERNPNAPYCRVVIAPKLRQLGLPR